MHGDLHTGNVELRAQLSVELGPYILLGRLYSWSTQRFKTYRPYLQQLRHLFFRKLKVLKLSAFLFL